MHLHALPCPCPIVFLSLYFPLLTSYAYALFSRAVGPADLSISLLAHIHPPRTLNRNFTDFSQPRSRITCSTFLLRQKWALSEDLSLVYIMQTWSTVPRVLGRTWQTQVHNPSLSESLYHYTLPANGLTCQQEGIQTKQRISLNTEAWKGYQRLIQSWRC